MSALLFWVISHIHTILLAAYSRPLLLADAWVKFWAEVVRLVALRPREADFPLPDDGADALAARVPAPTAPRVRGAPRRSSASVLQALADLQFIF